LRIKNDWLDLGHASKRRLALLLLATSSGLMLSQPALASDITVASPVNGTNVSSPVWVRAHNVGCDSLSPSSFGYSIDNSSTLTLGVTAYDIDFTNQAIAAGSHTIHFKSWTKSGICPVISTTFTVSGTAPAPPPAPAPPAPPTPPSPPGTIPSNATSSGDIDGATSWEYEHDTGTPGASSGSSLYPATTPSYDDAREFYMTYSDRGGERWHLSFGNDTIATHFVYDTYVYFVDPSQVQNVEMDVNQVMANGETVIFGTQCASGSKTWEYTVIKNGSPHWLPSNIPCNPTTWTANTWHHVQVGVHRDSNGVVTHDWVTLDATQSAFNNAVGGSALPLGWALGDLLTNFQIDGYNADGGSITSYIHEMTVYYW
jgi:hypothetical protein